MSEHSKKFILPILGIALLSPIVLSNKGTFAVAFAEEEVNDKIVLRIKNSADYIYIDEEDVGDGDLIHQFEEYCAENTKFKNVEVIYETTDTNETLLTEMQTGKTAYDLVCPSEYMIQKMIHEGLLQPLNRPDRDDLLIDYDTYASKYIRNRLDSIEATNAEGDVVTLGDYAVGYMWGTLGLLFNPTYNENYENYSIQDMDYFSVLTNEKYQGTISIKDSIRDTYAAGLMYGYEEELLGYRNSYLAGDKTSEEYHTDIQRVFDRNGGEEDDVTDALDVVNDAWNKFKNNIFGLEVDSGKLDIIQGKIGMNLAWSGDAVYSMELGEEEGVYLDYAIPLNGSNIWFDAWVMPKNDNRSSYTEEVAYEFLNFISKPEYATKNVDYTGYTSFIGGEDICDLMKDWYDIRTDSIYKVLNDGESDDDYLSLYYLDPTNGDEETEFWYSDFHFEDDSDPAFDEVTFYYYDIDDEECENPIPFTIEDEETGNEYTPTYNEYAIIDEEWVEVDLNYFFNADFDDSSYEADPEFIFYTDEYYATYEVEDEETGEIIEVTSESVGGAFYCQFPDFETITRCAIMKDYGTQNEPILAMWESFKSNALPLWAIVVFVVEIGLVATFVAYFIISKRIKKSLRNQRKK